MTVQDVRDWFIMGCITAFSSALLAWVFVHPDTAGFAAVCGALPAMVGLYHWFTLRDSKTPDAG